MFRKPPCHVCHGIPGFGRGCPCCAETDEEREERELVEDEEVEFAIEQHQIEREK